MQTMKMNDLLSKGIITTINAVLSISETTRPS